MGRAGGYPYGEGRGPGGYPYVEGRGQSLWGGQGAVLMGRAGGSPYGEGRGQSLWGGQGAILMGRAGGYPYGEGRGLSLWGGEGAILYGQGLHAIFVGFVDKNNDLLYRSLKEVSTLYCVLCALFGMASSLGRQLEQRHHFERGVPRVRAVLNEETTHC